MQEFTSKRLYFRSLTEADATRSYADWLNTPAVNRFLEVRHFQHSIETCRDFISACNADPNCFLFGIFTNAGQTHIGNIKLGPHRQALRFGTNRPVHRRTILLE